MPLAVFSASVVAKKDWGNHLDKIPGYEIEVLSLWTKVELQKISPALDLKRYELYGGVPRLVVTLDEKKAATYVVQALDALTIKVVAGVQQPQSNPRPKHRILELQKVDGRCQPVNFISNHVWREVMKVQRNNFLQDAKQWAQMMNAHGLGKAVTGQMFEAYFHVQFADSKETMTINGTVVCCTSMIECTSDEIGTPVAGTHDKALVLYVPIARNNPTFDSYFIVVVGATPILVFLQLTVGTTHRRGKWSDMQTIAAFVTSSFKTKIEVFIVYVVPKNSTMAVAPAISNKPKTAHRYVKVQEAVIKASFDF